jgi:hypothetical protein
MTDDELAARLEAAARPVQDILDHAALFAAPAVLADIHALLAAVGLTAGELRGRTVVPFPDPGPEPTP